MDDFYAARSRLIPLLPWTTFSPPFSERIATGFSGHGFGLGTGAGLLAADLITGQSPCVDSTPFRLHRFSDGSEIMPMSGIIQR